jgi:hypothetical protein
MAKNLFTQTDASIPADATTIGSIVMWSTRGAVRVDAFNDTVVRLGLEGQVPTVSPTSAPTLFAGIVSDFARQRFNVTANALTSSRTMLLSSLMRGPNLMTYAINVANPLSRNVNDLTQVGMVGMELTVDGPRVYAEITDNSDEANTREAERVSACIIARFNEEYGMVSAVQLNYMLTRTVEEGLGTVRIIGGRQDWFVPNLTALGDENPMTRTLNLVRVLRECEGSPVDIRTFRLSNDGEYPEQVRLAVLETIEERTNALRTEVNERLAAEPGKRALRSDLVDRLESDAYRILSLTTIYGPVLTAADIAGVQVTINQILASVKDLSGRTGRAARA